MEWSLETFLLANTILILASILQMATGVSIGMIIVPFLAMISYTLVPVPVVFASLTLTVMMAYQGREHIDMKNVPQVSVGMFLGILVAVYLLKNIHFEYLGLVFGLLILVSVFISLKVKSFKLGRSLNYTGGFMAGLIGAMAAVGGQILALVFQNHSLASIKATLAVLYTFFTFAMLGIFYMFDEFRYQLAAPELIDAEQDKLIAEGLRGEQAELKLSRFVLFKTGADTIDISGTNTYYG